MPDPRLVSRAQRAATMLERAWDRWRSAQGLAAEPLPPVSSYVGYSIEEPWGRPRVVFGVDAEDAERLAALLQESTRPAGPGEWPDDGSERVPGWNGAAPVPGAAAFGLGAAAGGPGTPEHGPAAERGLGPVEDRLGIPGSAHRAGLIGPDTGTGEPGLEAGPGAGPAANGAAPGEYGAGPGEYGAGPGEYGAGPGEYGAGPSGYGTGPGGHGAGPGAPGHGGSLLDDVRGRIPVQGWPADFTDRRDERGGPWSGPQRPGSQWPGQQRPGYPVAGPDGPEVPPPGSLVPGAPLADGPVPGGLVPGGVVPSPPVPGPRETVDPADDSAEELAGRVDAAREPSPGTETGPGGAERAPESGPAGPEQIPGDGRPELDAAAAADESAPGAPDPPGKGPRHRGGAPRSATRDGQRPGGAPAAGAEPGCAQPGGARPGGAQPGGTGWSDAPTGAGPGDEPRTGQPGRLPGGADPATSPGDQESRDPADGTGREPGSRPVDPPALQVPRQPQPGGDTRPGSFGRPGGGPPEGPQAAERDTDPAGRPSIADTMAAELAGWAAGELPGQASARLAAWATVGGAVARGRRQAGLGGGGTATERTG